MNIWVKWQNGRVEKVDTATKQEAAAMVREYRMAYGKAAQKVWAGKKSDG